MAIERERERERESIEGSHWSINGEKRADPKSQLQSQLPVLNLTFPLRGRRDCPQYENIQATAVKIARKSITQCIE